MSPLDAVARDLLQRFPVLSTSATLHALGSHGGFSGARLWRVQSGHHHYCLRAWPSNTTAERLHAIHTWMECLSLPFVPRILRCSDGTWTEEAGRFWELTDWMRGAADFHDHPGEARLRAVCIALAQVHRMWEPHRIVPGPCPGIDRRLRRVAEWQEMMAAGWRPPAHGHPALQFWSERAWQAVQSRVSPVPRQLEPWEKRAFDRQPCLCDIWHDHVLYTDDEVTGLVDYGAIKIDHVAVDLARLLGSLVGSDNAAWDTGLTAYRTIRPLSREEEALSRALDETGAVLAVATWLKWLYWDRQEFSDHDKVARHLARIVPRLEEFPR